MLGTAAKNDETVTFLNISMKYRDISRAFSSIGLTFPAWIFDVPMTQLLVTVFRK